MSVSVNTGLGAIPSARDLAAGAFGFRGPRVFIIAWALIAVLAYLSSAVGLVVTLVVAVFATLMVGVGFLWLGLRAVMG